MQTVKLPTGARIIIDTLEVHGHRADIVGGCVRDAILSREANDYDITTDASPEATCEIFKDYKTVKTGLKHGTLTVMIDGEGYEVTTYRRDGEYKDHRHPDEVFFTDSLREDLSRRDFTVNAICYSPSHGFTDPFDGVSDIKRKIIRAVGDPVKRFDEDALRIMRAVRFAAALGFEIEKGTASALREKQALLSGVSGERIFVELRKLLSSADGAYPVLCEYADVISTAIGNESIHIPEEGRFNAERDYSVRLFSLFCNEVGDADLRAFERVCDRLRVDNALRGAGRAALSSLGADVESRENIRLALFELGAENVRYLIKLKMLLGMCDGTPMRLLDSILDSGDAWTYRHLAVNGNDLLPLGISGTHVGDALRDALFSVIRGEVENARDELIKFIKTRHG